MPRPASVLAAAALAWPVASTAAAPAFEHHVVAVAAVDERLPADRFDFGPLDGLRGTRVAVVLSLPDSSDHRVVGLDAAESTVIRARDDTGRDLLSAPPPSGTADGPDTEAWSGGPKLFGTPSSDGRHLLVELSTPRSPAPAAHTVSVSATARVRLARGRQSLATPGVVLQPGAFELASTPTALTAPLTAQISAVTQEDWGQGVFTHVTFRFDGPAAARVSALRLLDPSGAALGGDVRSTVRYGGRSDFTYALPAARTDRDAPVTLELTLWNELTVVPVELEVSAPLGLSE